MLASRLSNTMETKETIENDMRVSLRLIENATYHIYNLEYLNDTKNKKHLEVLQKFTFLNDAITNLWSVTILDLSKLLSTSQNDKFRLGFIINRLIKNYENISWYRDIGVKNLSNFLERIEDHQASIKRLRDIRDNRIAHFDELKEKFDLRVCELKPLLELCQKIHNDISFALYGKSTIWKFSDTDMVFPLTDSLINYYNLRNGI